MQLVIEGVEGGSEFSYFCLHVSILIQQFFPQGLSISYLPHHVFDLELILSSGAIEFLFILDPEHVDLVILLLLQLGDGLLFESGLLQHLGLLLALLELQPFHLCGQLTILYLELSGL